MMFSRAEISGARRALLKKLVAVPALSAVACTSRARADALADTRLAASEPVMRVRRLTWAGIMVEVGETALFVDVMPVDPKNGDPAELLTATKKPAAIVTHRHADHFSNAALRTVLGENGRLVAQSETLPGMDTRGLQVQSVSMWEPSFFPTWLGSDIVAFAVPAVDGFGTPQCSWIIDGGGSRIFHGGDTQWHGRWAEYGRAYGPFDAAFLPINGARMNLGRLTDDGVPAVLTPEQAVIAAGRLGANRLIPIHFGEPDPPTYNEVDHPLDRICSAAAGQVPLTVLQPGDWLTIEHSAHGRGPVSGAARQR